MLPLRTLILKAPADRWVHGSVLWFPCSTRSYYFIYYVVINMIYIQYLY